MKPITVNTSQKKYDCIIEKGVLKNLCSYLDLSKRHLIVIDTKVDITYLDNLNHNNIYIYYFSSSEHNKSFESYKSILSFLLENNFSRDDVIVSCGGGVTGDLCGFVAATYKRGIKFINCPTTTLSCIDSSIGGKVAINLDGVKNVVGQFYQPSLVLIDPDVLNTLSERHFNNGLVEALKTGLIGDESLYNIFLTSTNYKEDIVDIIYKSLSYKKMIVEKDEFEKNERKLLNFGHTIGHAIESINLDNIYHGEAVGLGMLYMIDDDKLLNEVKGILQKLNINTDIKYEYDDVIAYIKNDKKASNDTIDIIRVNHPASSYITKVKIEEIKNYME